MEDLEIHLQVWKTLKPHLIGGDVDAAAEDFINILVEHGADAEEIATYGVDSALKLALRGHIELDADDEELIADYDEEFED